MATTVRIVLPAGVTKGYITRRRRNDKSREVNVQVPFDADVQFVTPSPSGTKGTSIIDNDGNKFFLEQ